MRIVTRREKAELAERLHAEAEAARAQMTLEERARAEGRRHQGARERARRLRQLAKDSQNP